MTQAGNPFDASTWPVDLRQAMSSIPAVTSIHVALSGGLDSVFLLHAVAAWCRHDSSVTVRALHVNHQLQAAAGHMEALCRRVCESLSVSLDVMHVDVNSHFESLENEARRSRYAAFESKVADGGCLLMAHHADDQAETVLFRLVRGAGTRGLAGMPQTRILGEGQLCRPLLEMERQRIETLARCWKINWVDDPTNTDTHFDRNFLRHRVLRPLKEHWPGAVRSMGRAARQCAESDELGRKLASLQREEVEDARGCLEVDKLARLSQAEQKNLLRWWLIDHRFEPPVAARLEQGLADLVSAGEDKMPVLSTDRYAVRRYQGYLHCVPESPPPPDEPIDWSTEDELPWADGFVRTSGPDAPPMQLTVSARAGGERLRPVPGGPSRPLKKWMQEQGIPPWERERIPLVWKDGELVAIAGVWVSPALVDTSGFASWRIVWERDCR